jgi:hypothetical protein
MQCMLTFADGNLGEVLGRRPLPVVHNFTLILPNDSPFCDIFIREQTVSSSLDVGFLDL